MSGGVGTLIVAGAGCVIASGRTTVEPWEDAGFRDHSKVEVVAREGCTTVDVRLPPGGRLVEADAKVKFGDGGGNRLGEARWEFLPRGPDGWARVRLHVPELLGGDRVKIEVSREVEAVSWDWTPGEDAIRFAELRLPRDHDWTVDAFGVQKERRGFWTVKPRRGEAVRLWRDPSARASDMAWSLGHPGLDLPPPPTPAPDQGVTSPAEAVSAVSRFQLLPPRPDWSGEVPPDWLPTDQAAALLAITADLPLAAVIDPQRPARPVGILPYTTPDGAVAPRVWAHLDVAWDPRWKVLTPTGPTTPIGPPAGPGPALDFPVQSDRRVRVDIPDGSDPGVALVPGGGSTVTYEDVVTLLPVGTRAPRAALVSPPGPGFRLAEPPTVDGDGRVLIPPTQDQALLLSTSGSPSFHLTWRAPDAPTCGGRFGPDVTLDDVEVPGATVQTDDDGWWLASWGGRPLASDRERVVNGLTARFNRRSLPEPGLPMRLRGRLKGWDLAAELPDTLRDRAVVAPLPGADALWPRRLHRARGSGVVTPFEAALIVRLYALQARFEADWVLVRSAGAPPGPELCAATYDAMLVRLRFEGEERWLDPACEACAPFEIRPELLGRPALGVGVSTSPEPVPGSLIVTVDGPEITWEAEGAAALELRRWLRDRPVKGRAIALAERMAGEGARLRSVVGAKERGVPIRAVATAARLDAVPDPGAVLLPPVDGRVVWPGTRGVRIADGEPTTIRLENGSWTEDQDAEARSTLGLQTFTER